MAASQQPPVPQFPTALTLLWLPLEASKLLQETKGLGFRVYLDLGPRVVKVVSAFVYPNNNQIGWANWTITLDFVGAEATTFIYLDLVDASVFRRSDNSVMATATDGQFGHRGNLLMINLRTTEAAMAVLGRDLVGWWNFGVSVLAWMGGSESVANRRYHLLRKVENLFRANQLRSDMDERVRIHQSCETKSMRIRDASRREGRRELDETQPYDAYLICGEAMRLTIEVYYRPGY